MTTKLEAWLILGLLLGTAVYALAEDITLTVSSPPVNSIA